MKDESKDENRALLFEDFLVIRVLENPDSMKKILTLPQNLRRLDNTGFHRFTPVSFHWK